MSKYKFPGSVIYMGLSGEEQGLYGGEIVAKHALENNWRVKAVLNNDMISNITGINGVTNNTTARVFSEGTRDVETPEEARARRFAGGEVDSPSRNIARFIDRQADKRSINQPQADTEKSEFMQDLETAVTNLPETMGTAFRMREMQGCSTDEITNTLNISRSNLWVLIHRAKQALSEQLSPSWLGHGEFGGFSPA
jgi:RNA polymerase sigma factor (sigma-70 family)